VKVTNFDKTQITNLGKQESSVARFSQKKLEFFLFRLAKNKSRHKSRHFMNFTKFFSVKNVGSQWNKKKKKKKKKGVKG